MHLPPTTHTACQRPRLALPSAPCTICPPHGIAAQPITAATRVVGCRCDCMTPGAARTRLRHPNRAACLAVWCMCASHAGSVTRSCSRNAALLSARIAVGSADAAHASCLLSERYDDCRQTAQRLPACLLTTLAASSRRWAAHSQRALAGRPHCGECVDEAQQQAERNDYQCDSVEAAATPACRRHARHRRQSDGQHQRWSARSPLCAAARWCAVTRRAAPGGYALCLTRARDCITHAAVRQQTAPADRHHPLRSSDEVEPTHQPPRIDTQATDNTT